MGIGEKDNSGKVPFLSHHIKSSHYQYKYDLSLWIIFVMCLRWSLSGVSIVMWLFIPLSLSMEFSLGGSDYV